jgi:hypothetical protein
MLRRVAGMAMLTVGLMPGAAAPGIALWGAETRIHQAATL